MRKEFEIPVIELVLIDSEDIIKTSGTTNYGDVKDGRDYQF